MCVQGSQEPQDTLAILDPQASLERQVSLATQVHSLLNHASIDACP